MSAIDLGWIPLFVPKGILDLLAKFGPSLAGLMVIYYEKGKDGIFTALKSLTRFKVALKWYIFALFFELILFFIIAALSSVTGIPDLEINWSLLRKSGWVFIVNAIHLTLLTGLGEEIGWRGFLLPKLQSRYSVMIAALILSFMNSFWHLRIDCLKLLLINDVSGFAALYFPDLGLRLLISTPVIFIIIYLFNKTYGSLLMMVIFHGTANASYEWLKYISGSNDPSFALPVFAALLWLSSLYFIPAIKKQGKKGELRTFIS
ncbi:MAG: CPBP family intramembrane metalloprotease [bacterium]|nr:CPBP family intramembrane metalloprotease [bacterium]